MAKRKRVPASSPFVCGNCMQPINPDVLRIRMSMGLEVKHACGKVLVKARLARG